MSNLLAAVGRGAAAKDCPAKVARRRAINAAYRDALADVPGHRVHARRAATASRPTGSPCHRRRLDDSARRRGDAGAPRGARHRGASRVEADAPAAGVRRLRDARRARSPRRSSARGLCLPERLEHDRRRRRPRRRRVLECRSRRRSAAVEQPAQGVLEAQAAGDLVAEPAHAVAHLDRGAGEPVRVGGAVPVRPGAGERRRVGTARAPRRRPPAIPSTAFGYAKCAGAHAECARR